MKYVARNAHWPHAWHALFTASLVAALLVAAGCSPSGIETALETQETLELSLIFHASFDNGPEAEFAGGDSQIYSAPSYKESEQAKTGINLPHVEIVSGQGRFGDALRFNKKNTEALFYQAKNNVNYSPEGWNGTISFWLSLDPAVDLEPGYCDPIQVTDAAYNDAAVWVDFTKENPRQFRLGVFGDLEAWNPEDLPPDENPDFQNRLVAVENPPFARGKWTHVVITYSGLGSAAGGSAKLYLDGKLQGVSPDITEPFTWDLEKAAIRLGVNYVGLYDELAIFDVPLKDDEVLALHQLEDGVDSLHE